VGNGWKMLMQSLTTGRSISLPALSVAAGKYVCRNTGAYARIRKQFNLPIGEFEGIEEPLARMAGETYLMDAAREVTLAALDNGQSPSVISAIVKYELTERMRAIVNDAMDIQGGSGICLGPQNYIGRLYQVIPVCITVEGANILTRTMMIFGQGAVRCHPYIQEEMEALHNEDKQQALQQFDKVLFQHIGAVINNKVSSIWLGITNARFANVPGDEQTIRYYRQIARLSVNFALVADYALLTLAGAVKRKERLSGRFADVLSNLYLCSCALKKFQDQGSRKDELPLLHWACQHTIYCAQQALYEIFRQLPFQPLAWAMRAIVFPFGKPNLPPGDQLIHEIAALLLSDSEARERLTSGIYINEIEDDATGRIELAFKAVLAAAPAEAKIRQAQRQKQLLKGTIQSQLKAALEADIITQQDVDLIEQAELARFKAISVDDFSAEELTGIKQT
jgi:acyl-CoA dehydrogenase